jgi:prefoldin subunit 5
MVPPPAAPLTGEAEVQLLKSQAEYLEGSLADIRKRLGELEKESADK